MATHIDIYDAVEGKLTALQLRLKVVKQHRWITENYPQLSPSLLIKFAREPPTRTSLMTYDSLLEAVTELEKMK